MKACIYCGDKMPIDSAMPCCERCAMKPVSDKTIGANDDIKLWDFYAGHALAHTARDGRLAYDIAEEAFIIASMMMFRRAEILAAAKDLQKPWL